MHLIRVRLVKDLCAKHEGSEVVAVFLTDVEGLYDRPPDSSTPVPRLIPQIYVTKDGKVSDRAAESDGE
jgi:hypothetical protein